jgi:adenylate cyclase
LGEAYREFLVEAYRGLGVTLFCRGDLSTSRDYLAQSLSLYDPQRHQAHAILYGHDPSVVCRFYLSWTLSLMGYPAQALVQGYDALGHAQTLSHPHTLAFAFIGAAFLHQFRRELQLVREQVEAAMSLTSDQGFVLYATYGTILRGWERGVQGEVEAGITQLQQGLAGYHAIGAEVLRSYFLFLLAEVHEQAGQQEEGLRVLAEALCVAHATGERLYEPELYRLKGELLLQQSSDTQVEAENCFQQAISIAQHQKAKSLELRAATSLARFWQQQGKRQEAHDLLAPVYNWFTEGFDTADLKDAKALLDTFA